MNTKEAILFYQNTDIVNIKKVDLVHCIFLLRNNSKLPHERRVLLENRIDELLREIAHFQKPAISTYA